MNTKTPQSHIEDEEIEEDLPFEVGGPDAEIQQIQQNSDPYEPQEDWIERALAITRVRQAISIAAHGPQRMEQERTVTKKKEFLEVMRKNFGTIGVACDKIDIERTTYYHWMKTDPQFRSNVAQVDQERLDMVDDEIYALLQKHDGPTIRWYGERMIPKYKTKSQTELITPPGSKSFEELLYDQAAKAKAIADAEKKMENQLNNQELIPYLPHNDVVKSLFSIRNKRGMRVPYIPNASQLHYRKHKTRRNLVLKGRQQGLSKEIDADQLADCLKKSTNAVVISHEKEATKRLFSAVRYYIDSMDQKPTVSIDSKSEMKFPLIGSSYFIGTAGQKAFGRGDTVDRAHLSEAAFYDNLETILSGIAEAAEYGQIDIETTPNGREHFYDLWQKAKAGLSPYTPIFIPWYMHEEYTSEKLTEKEIAGLSPAVRALFATPEADFQWTDEEKDLWRKVNHEHGISLSVGQIKWRRYKIWDKGELFWQEYPEDDETCFLQSGRSVFKTIKVDATLKIPLDAIEKMKPEDVLRLRGDKKKGIRKKTLHGAIDPAEGTLTGDAHVFSVIEGNSPYHKENGAVVIFEMTSNEPIDVFAAKVKKITDLFDIILGIEHQGVGVAMANKCRELEIPFEEWDTTATSRPILIADLEEAYRKGNLIETYIEAEGEARNMIYNSKNRPEHPSGKHDDRVFSRGIALQMFNKPKPNFETW